MNELEEIKNKLDIVEVVSGYIPLKQSGRNFKAPCPFHSEKTPSFMVSPEKQIWHCFGCNEGGDIFGFVMKMEGLDFYSALKILAEKAGITLQTSPKDLKGDKDKKNRFFSMNDFATEYYQEKLMQKEGELALKYLKNRGITEQSIKEFRLGFAPNSKNELLDQLKKMGFTEKEIKESGLAKDKGGKTFDYFWERIIFPIADHSGSIVGFSARGLKDDAIPKYLNTPETAIYHKSFIFYGLDKAKASIRKSDHAILVEGNMDVIASHQAGVKNTVATSGTALTKEQLNIIKRFSHNLKLCFDMDNAGQEATKRAIELAQDEGFNIKIIEVPEDHDGKRASKDPADVVHKDKKLWIKYCKNAKYVVDYIFEKSFNKHNKESALGKKEIARELLKVIKKLPSKIEQEHYLKILGLELSVSEKALKEALEKAPIKKEEKTSYKKEVKEKTNVGLILEEKISGLLILFPEYKNYLKRNLKTRFFKDQILKEMFEAIVMEEKLKEEEVKRKDLLEIKTENDYSNFSSEQLEEELFFCVKRLKSIRLQEERKELIEKLGAIENNGEKEKTIEAIKELDLLIKET